MRHSVQKRFEDLPEPITLQVDLVQRNAVRQAHAVMANPIIAANVRLVGFDA